MVRMVEHATLSFTVRFSSSEKNLFVCRLGYCQYALCLLENVTRLALLARLPVMSHMRLICRNERRVYDAEPSGKPRMGEESTAMQNPYAIGALQLVWR